MTVEAVDVVLDEVGVPLTLIRSVYTALQGSGTGGQCRGAVSPHSRLPLSLFLASSCELCRCGRF